MEVGTKQLAQQDSRLIRAPKARRRKDAREGWETIPFIRMYTLLLRAMVMSSRARRGCARHANREKEKYWRGSRETHRNKNSRTM